MSAQREMRKLLREYRHLGWTVEYTRSSHLKLYPPGRTDKFVVVSGTPGNSRAIVNIRSDLKRLERSL